MEVIERLKQAGYTVRVTHYRIPARDSKLVFDKRNDPDFVRALYPTYVLRDRGEAMWEKGGGTTVQVKSGNRVVAHGESLCNPMDNFSRKLGTEIALGRAIFHLRPAGQRRILRQSLKAMMEGTSPEWVPVEIT